jgi:hypothetical protein
MALCPDPAWCVRMTVRLDINGMMGHAGVAEKKAEVEA